MLKSPAASLAVAQVEQSLCVAPTPFLRHSYCPGDGGGSMHSLMLAQCSETVTGVWFLPSRLSWTSGSNA